MNNKIAVGNDSRETVGYVRSFQPSESACDIQESLIQRYCEKNSIVCKRIFRDLGYSKTRQAGDRWKAERLGLDTKRWLHTFEAWEDMLLGIMDGEIGRVLVDTRVRLFDGAEQKRVLERLCVDYSVTIIEVADAFPPDRAAAVNAAIYHYPAQFGARTCILLNDIDSLYDYASHRKRWEVASLFLDLSPNNREEFAYMLEMAKCDIVLVKNFFHVKRHTSAFVGVVKQLHKKGIRLVSMDEGELNISDKECVDLMKQPLKVAVYDHHKSEYQEENENLQMDKFKAFVKYKTNGWTIKKVYIDGIRAGTQDELQQLINDVGEYDIILLDSFDKLGETIRFTKIVKKLNIPMFSLKEGVYIDGAEDL